MACSLKNLHQPMVQMNGGQTMLIGGGEDGFEQAVDRVVIFHPPAEVEGEALVAAGGMAGEYRLHFFGGVDPVEPAKGQGLAAGDDGVGPPQLNALEAVPGEPTQGGFAGQPRPDRVLRQGGEVVGIE